MNKKLKNKNGITLIALVVTIVVLLIVAGVSLSLVLQNNGIINKSKEAKVKYEEAKTNEINDMSNISAWIDKNTSSNNDEYKGITVTENTEGITFTKADGTTAGDSKNLEKGDTVICGDYEYRYNQTYYDNPFGSGWSDKEDLDGWGVKAIDRSKSEYGELCGNIFGKTVKDISFLFGYGGNTNLVEAPAIPDGIENMGSAFQNCGNLQRVEKIPKSVINMSYAFSGCTKLTGTIVIDANPTEYNNWLNTSQKLIITGASTKLKDLADAASSSNITIK